MNTFLNYVLYFFAYSALGWFIESVYVSIAHRKLTNRGFLKGPMCPIYGTGALVFSVCLEPFSRLGRTVFVWNFFDNDRTVVVNDKFWLVIIFGMIFADTVEFLTSLIMEKLFHARWWDYSDKKFNIQGRICLRHTIYWGIMSTLFVYVIHPFMKNFVFRYVTDNTTVRNYVVGIVFAIFIIDVIFAVIAAADLSKLLSKITKLNESFDAMTDNLKSNIEHKYEELQSSAAKQGQKLSAWKNDAAGQLSEIRHYFDKTESEDRRERKKAKNAKRIFESVGSIKKQASDAIDRIEKFINGK